MSPENGLNFLAYNRSNFLDKECYQNVSTRLDFARFQHWSTWIIC